MSVSPGSHRIGPDQGRLLLRTYRDGLAASVGHDLLIELTRWSAELTTTGDDAAASLTARLDLTSLAVREGTGGIKPLTERDRREIGFNARKQLSVDQHPEDVFTSTSASPDEKGGGTVDGTLTLQGVSHPLRLTVTHLGDVRYRAAAQVVQSAYGIKPYSAMLGTLKVRDAIEVEIEVDLSGSAGAAS
jgi:polyisoprenoid-binding protein YceI